MQKLHIETPLLELFSPNRITEGDIRLKMEALQPSGSFKIRGIGHACTAYAQKGARKFIASSGGNAGLAVAYAGKRLGIPVTVVVPETTPLRARELILALEAEVVVSGSSWYESHAHAMGLCNENSAYLHPFDDPLIWEGHATLIDEVAEAGFRPDAVVLSVGGGGLLCGVLTGLAANNMAEVPVVAVETMGADALHRSLKKGERVELPAITSIAGSLGAKKVAQKAFEWSRSRGVVSRTVTDGEAVEAALRFAEDHRVIVEPACGASLSVIYSDMELAERFRNILAIVCGGSATTMEQLHEFHGDLAGS